MSRVKVLPIGRALISGLAALSLLLPSPALAVTYGNPVENPLEKAPYVVSVWASESGDTREAEFICSGTLISSNIILTAAHCTDFENLKFFVKIKTVALMQEAPFYAATPWTGTRYDPGSKVKPPEGDIGLLRINTNITGVKFPSLANSQIAKKINKNTSLILMGWGYDQNKKLADTLRFSKLTLQDARSQKDWSGYFNIKTMISAGKFIKDEKKWSGSCNGDSGGPLLAELSGLTYVVGVTSWGHKQCRTEIPSVFSRVSYYERDIQAGIKAVDLLATSVNRLAPVEVIAPSMKGEGTPGTSLVCDPGTWVNAVSVEINWTSPSRLVGNTNPEAKVIAADIGQEFRCRILAKSKSGNSETTVDRYVSRVLPKKIAVASPPVIGGLEGTQSIKPGTTARCENWNWAEPVDQEVVEWFSSTSSNPSTPVNGKLLGTGREIRLTQELLKSERGRYLVCQLTGTRAGFPSYLIATKLISTADSPIINNVTVTAPSLRNGINASCSFSGTSNAERIQYEWGYSGAGNEFTAFGGQNADFIRITPQILKQASGQKLACKVTITNLGESVSRVGTSFEVFESELDAPKPSISVSNTPYVGSSASCSIPNSSRYSSVTYSWGITTSPDSGNFISGVLGNFRDLTFDSRILVSSAGNYITCVVTVANEISKAQGIASSKISVSAAPSLPSMSAPYISNQTRMGSQINVSISIPSAFGFDQSTMEAKLRLPGSNCDGNVLNSFPSTIVCSGLAGNRDYSVYTEVRYSTNSQIPSRQSSIGTFRTNDATAAPSISLSNATQSVNVNSAISTVNVSNSGGAVSSFSISPSLPIGLTFNSGTGSISGTPSQAQSQRSYTITATNSGGSSSATFTLTVIVAVAAPSISLSNATQSVNANSAISTVNVVNSGGAVNSFSISPSLPSGLTFNSSNGSISGTPTQAQSQSSYTITATNSGGSSSATFTLTVVAGLVVIPITGGLPVASTSVGSNVVASFRATDGLGITNAWVRVWNSAENSLQGFGEGTYTANLISGNNLDGTYQATINTSVPGYANGGTFTVGVQIGGNNRITEWKVIGTFILSVPVSTIDTYPLNGVVIGGGRGGTWAFQTFDRASNLLVTAVARSSNGGPNIIAARFLKSRSESTNSSYPDEWQATFEVPNGTLNGTVYRIYWTLRNTDGTTREYSGGEFRVG